MDGSPWLTRVPPAGVICATARWALGSLVIDQSHRNTNTYT